MQRKRLLDVRQPTPAEFSEAKNFELRFGKYKTRLPTDRTLDAIAKTDEGLIYLDWLCGSLEGGCQEWQKPALKALQAYLGDGSIQKELAGAIKRRPRGPTNADREKREQWGM